jgi:hypothetical protein
VRQRTRRGGVDHAGHRATPGHASHHSTRYGPAVPKSAVTWGLPPDWTFISPQASTGFWRLRHPDRGPAVAVEVTSDGSALGRVCRTRTARPTVATVGQARFSRPYVIYTGPAGRRAPTPHVVVAVPVPRIG